MREPIHPQTERFLNFEEDEPVASERGAFKSVGSAVISVIEATKISYDIAALCESPIEILMGSWLLSTMKQKLWYPLLHTPICLCLQADQHYHGSNDILIIPQYKFSRFRYDWAIYNPMLPRRHYRQPLTFIECDGAEFHSSPEQRANDAEKDAAADRLNIRVIRFTGSELWRDPVQCVDQVVAWMGGWQPSQ